MGLDLLATDAVTTKIELVCGRLCRGRDCHTWHAANAIADAAVSILEAGRTRLQEYMRDAGFTDFSTAAWRCAIDPASPSCGDGGTSGTFTSPTGARFSSFGEVARFQGLGGDGRTKFGALTVGHPIEGGGEWQPGMQDLHIDGTSPFRNFFEIKDESTQDAVCDAFEELLADPLGANLQTIADRHGVAVVGRLRSASAVTDLHIAMDNLEMRIRGGQSMRLLCRSWPNRCGGDAIIKIMKRRLRRSSMIFEQGEGPCTMCDIDDEKDNEDDENMNMNRAGSMQAMGDVNSGGEDGSRDNDSIQIGDSSNEAADDTQHDLSGMSSGESSGSSNNSMQMPTAAAAAQQAARRTTSSA